MTQHAREVLRDCESVLDELRGSTELRWRTRWVAVLALLRAVGHVLYKVDAKENPAVGAVVTAEWGKLNRTKPEPAIFWEFIEGERNNILKVYRFGARENVTMRPGWGPTTYEHVMIGGSFAERDPRDIVQVAIAWWREYLDEVDRRVTEGASGPAR